MSDLYGIWIGENATVAIVKDYQISFLRLEEEVIVSVLKHINFGTVAVVYGFGKNFNAHAVVSAKNPESGVIFNSSDNAQQNLINHSEDKIYHDENNNKLIYEMYGGMKFDLVLAEKIDMNYFDKVNEIDNDLSISERMALWSVRKYFEYKGSCFNAGIDTQKYSILFYISIEEDRVYCRVGQNGFCEKGRAMLSAVCIRHNECRMLENNLLSINDYRPMEECFVADGCAFPSDGGWYWSIKKVTDDIIYLHGCGGAVYEIRRI